MSNTTLLASRRATPVSDTISVGRKLDSSVAKRFTRTIAKLVNSGARWCTIDMSAVESADSGGFGALMMALRKLEEVGAHVVVVCANPAIRKLFEVATVSRFAPVVARPEDARRLHATFASGLAS
jgi:anti-sigma B factor antagonist